MRATFPLSLLLCLFPFIQSEAQLDQALQDIFESNNLMGMSVVSICDAQVWESHHFGLRDFDDALPVNDSTMFRIASISKSFTATALMKLHAQGLFNLEDDISTHLEYELRNPNHPETVITMEMLLSHRAGIQDGTAYSAFLDATYNGSDVPSIGELLLPGGQYYSANMWRQEVPGTYFVYSNACYGLVGTLLEAISGQRFDEFLRDELLLPLGIRGSFNTSDIPDISNLAALYRFQNGAWNSQLDEYNGIPPAPVVLNNYIPGTNGLRFAPQGGLRASALELAEFAILHIDQGNYGGDQLIDSASIEAMHTPVWTYNGSNGDNYFGLFRSWGLGIQLSTNTSGGDLIFSDSPMLGHPGEAYGLISDWYFNPETRSGFVFITNGAQFGYSFGSVSAYYSVEEEVFQALEASGLPLCATNLNESEQQELNLFPNPCNDRCWLDATGLQSAELFHTDGSRVRSFVIPPQTGLFALDFSGLPSGIYILKAQKNGSPLIRRIIRQ